MAHFDESQKEFWEENTNLRPYDHPVVQAFANQRVDFIRGLLGGAGIRSALEVGCGDGFGTHYMRELVQPIYGSDISLAMLRGNPVGRQFLSQADIYNLPYPARTFDLVYCWEVLHHVREPLRAIREMMRVSRRFVLIFEPNSFNLPMALFGLLMPSDIGLLRFTPWYLGRLLKKAGVGHLRTFTVGCLTPNRTPEALARILIRLPYRWPVIGITNAALGEVEA
ncbi:MAG: type 11 methyltransferase [Anaerolineaceae bacterium]|nr:MAG: type 11 methyltransferase [Anaerolineaceae bacterium]